MLKYAVLFLFAVPVFTDIPCCEEKVRAISYLDIAVDLISKAKNSIPGCKQKKECPEIEATDCADWYKKGYNKSGVYKINSINRLTYNKSLDVFCDMDTEGGGWTVIQRRGNFGRPNDYFYKDWKSYKEGFGDVDRDFWLGNDKIFALTNQKSNLIRFDLQAKDLQKGYAVYSDFWIDDESNSYTLHISNYSGNTGDSMSYHDKKKFSTKDQNNNRNKNNCAVDHKSAWWFDYCHNSHLNGLYNATTQGLCWFSWRKCTVESLIWSEMKIRPKSFIPKVI